MNKKVVVDWGGDKYEGEEIGISYDYNNEIVSKVKCRFEVEYRTYKGFFDNKGTPTKEIIERWIDVLYVSWIRYN